jgi:membrane protein implicated in regulation of membrane protease activity
MPTSAMHANVPLTSGSVRSSQRLGAVDVAVGVVSSADAQELVVRAPGGGDRDVVVERLAGRRAVLVEHADEAGEVLGQVALLLRHRDRVVDDEQDIHAPAALVVGSVAAAATPVRGRRRSIVVVVVVVAAATARRRTARDRSQGDQRDPRDLRGPRRPRGAALHRAGTVRG